MRFIRSGTGSPWAHAALGTTCRRHWGDGWGVGMAAASCWTSWVFEGSSGQGGLGIGPSVVCFAQPTRAPSPSNRNNRREGCSSAPGPGARISPFSRHLSHISQVRYRARAGPGCTIPGMLRGPAGTHNPPSIRCSRPAIRRVDARGESGPIRPCHGRAKAVDPIGQHARHKPCKNRCLWTPPTPASR